MASAPSLTLAGIAFDHGRRAHALAFAVAAMGVAGGIVAGTMVGAGVNPIYPFGLLAIVAFGIVSLIEPQWAVVVAVAVGMGRISDVAIRFGGAPSIYKPLVAVLALLVLLQLLRRGYGSLAMPRSLGIMGLFLLSQSVSALFASDADVAFDRLEDLTRDFAIAFLVACLLRTTRGVHWTIWGVVLLGAVLSTLTVYQGATGDFSQQFFGLAQAYQQHIVGEISEPRSSGPFGDPNFYAQYLVVFATLSMFRAIDERNWLLRLAAIGALGLNVGALMLTYSRGGLVALGGALLLVLWLRRPSPRTVVAGAALLLLMLPAVPQNLVDRVGTMVDLLPGGAQGAGLEISFRGRMSELLAGLEMFVDHPIVGVGPGNSPLRYQEYAADIGLEYRRAERSTHNTFVEIAAEGGLPGLTLFSLAILSVIADLRFAARRLRAHGEPAASLPDALLVAIVAFLLAGAFLALTYPRGLWLLMALAIGIRRVSGGAQRGVVSSTQDAEAGPTDSPARATASIIPVTRPAGRTGMKPLRVLHLVDLFTVGGAEQLLPMLGSGLRELGADPSFAALFRYPRSHVVDRLEQEGFRATVVGLRGLRPDGLRALRRFIAAERPDIVHAHLTYASILGVAAASSLRIPSVVTLHQIGDVEPCHPNAAARELLFRAVVGLKANRVISVSNAVARHYVRRGIPRRKLRVVHNAIDIAPFRRAIGSDEREALSRDLEIPPGARVLVCVAMLRPGKGIGVLVRAMRAALERVPNAVLLIVGDGSERPRIEREIAAHDLARSVRLLGTRDDVPEILQLAELFVLPTRSALSAFPTVLIEACAAGVPSVASNIGGVPEIVRDGKEAILTPVGDERALADAIVTLLSNRDLRRTLAEAARARASAFSIPAWASAVLDVYREVAPESAASREHGPGQREGWPLTPRRMRPDRER